MGKCHCVTNEVDANVCSANISFSVCLPKKRNQLQFHPPLLTLFLKTSQEKKSRGGKKKGFFSPVSRPMMTWEEGIPPSKSGFIELNFRYRSSTLKRILHFLQLVFVDTLPRTYDSHISTPSKSTPSILQYLK